MTETRTKYRNGSGRNGYHSEEQEEPSLADKLCNVEAEKAALGATLIEPGQTWKLPQPEAFYQLKHKWIAQALFALFERGIEADVLTLSDELERMGHLEDVGGPAYLAQLMYATPSSVYLEHYAQIVNRKAQTKRLWEFVLGFSERFWEPEENIDELLAWGVRTMEDLVQGAAPVEDKARSTTQAAYDTLERYEERKRQRESGQPMGWAPPYSGLARHVPYLAPGSLFLLYGEGGAGKTVMAYQWHEHWQREEHRGVFYQNEMGDEDVDNRRMVRLSGVNLGAIRTGTATAEQEDAMSQAVQIMHDWPGYYVNAGGWHIDEIILDLERRVRQDGIEYFMVDNLKLMLGRPSPRQVGARMNETQLFGDIIRQLKNACTRLGLRALVLHHPNREGQLYGSTDLHDLVDVVCQLKPRTALLSEKYPGTDRVVAQRGDVSWWIRFNLEKNRFGAQGRGGLFFERPLFRINPAYEMGRMELEED